MGMVCRAYNGGLVVREYGGVVLNGARAAGLQIRVWFIDWLNRVCFSCL